MMKHAIYGLLLICAVTMSAQTTSNVVVEQVGKKVVVTYDLDKLADISLCYSVDGGKTYSQPLQQVSGDVGKQVSAGTNKRITWEVLAEREKLVGSGIVFKVVPSESVINKALGTASVKSSTGRTSCEWVQLWEGGPKWATFNVGATITSYSNLQKGSNNTSFFGKPNHASYHNTANEGGLYAWNNPNINGRQVSWAAAHITPGLSDIATTLWGNNWITPSKQQLDTLKNSLYTTWTWCNGNDVQYVPGCKLEGYKVNGKGYYEDCSIFLPAAGEYQWSLVIINASYVCNYWSSTKKDAEYIYALNFSPYTHNSDIYHEDMRMGLSVRAVLAEALVESGTQTTNKQQEAITKAQQMGALFGHTSSTEGINDQPGDNVSVVNGNPLENGMTCGNSWNLDGRSLVGSLPKPNNNFNQEGRVVVHIIVNNEGRVVNARTGEGTTILDETTKQLAVKAAMQTKFNVVDKPNAVMGTITYYFKFK